MNRFLFWMCGITGVLGEIDKVTLTYMANSIKHRGPDGGGLYLDNGIGLGHRRLSIIDLKKGDQPMSDGRYVVIFNGEIYNFKELRSKLEGKYRFRTDSDTEVLLYMYVEYGEKCLKFLNGMFAFAVYDTKEKNLFLARDRVGIKPLYYYREKNLFVFGSEIKSILEYPKVEKVVNRQAVYEFFVRQYISAPDTIFRGIYKLEPGHYLKVDKNGVIKNKYWDLNYFDSGISENEAIFRLKELMEQSVNRRLIADVPLGAFLSGGIDSSIIVSLMHKLKGEGIKTFSVGFNEKDYDERQYSRLVSETYKTDHEEIIVGNKEMKLMDKVVYHLDEPLADFAALPTMILSEFAKRKVKVVLTGEGGDENFAGYDYYWYFMKIYNYGKFIPNFLGNGKLNEMIYNINRRYAMLLTAARSKEDLWKRKMYGFNDTSHLFKKNEEEWLMNKLVGPWFSNGNFLNEMLRWDTKVWLPDDLLMKVDKMSMSHGLEARVPFLDYGVLEFNASLPIKFKINGKERKYLLKKTFSKDIPLEILNRKKSGFDVPIKEWFSNDYRGKIDGLVAANSKLVGEFFNLGKVRRMMQHNRNDLFLWRLYNFILWRDQYFR